MKLKSMLCACLLLLATLIHAQEIVKMEYSIDTFVKAGNGIAIAVDKGQEIESAFNLDISTLSPGIHNLYIRTQNDQGKWSFPVVKTFYISSPKATEVGALEYSIDTFVKEQNGVTIDTEDGSTLDTLLSVDISSLEKGIHNLYVRSQNDAGVWSLPTNKTFYVQEKDTAKIDRFEYRISTPTEWSDWNTGVVQPSKNLVDSILYVSQPNFSFDSTYTIEVYPVNTRNEKGYPVMAMFNNLRENMAPIAVDSVYLLEKITGDTVFISLDTMFYDIDTPFGDAHVYSISALDTISHEDVYYWVNDSLIAVIAYKDQPAEFDFWVKSTDLNQTSDSLKIHVIAEKATNVGIDDLSSTHLILYPNPTSGLLNVKWSNSNDNAAKFEVYNLLGEKVYSNVFKQTINISNLDNGTYFIRIISGKETGIYKILKR